MRSVQKIKYFQFYKELNEGMSCFFGERVANGASYC